MVERITRTGPWLLVVAALVALVSIIALSVAPGPQERGYAAFLDGVTQGRVTSVVQTGSRLEVVAADGTYQVEVPSILTDVYGEIQVATGGIPTVAFSAQPAPDAPWLALGPILLVNVVLVGGMLALAVVLLRRRPGSTA